jgi:hypothetical protein
MPERRMERAGAVTKESEALEGELADEKHQAKKNGAAAKAKVAADPRNPAQPGQQLRSSYGSLALGSGGYLDHQNHVIEID